MKKQYAALAIFILAIHCTQVISKTLLETKNDIAKDFENNSQRLLVKKNLFDEKMSPEIPTGWNSAINKTKKFVEENSKNQLGIKDADLMKALSTIERINDSLQNTLKITYGLRNNESGFSPQIDEFNKIRQAMITVRSNLKKAIFVLNKEQKMAAKDLLDSIAVNIEAVAKKATNDIGKLLIRK